MSTVNSGFTEARGFILGIDLGSNSLGTALVNQDSQEIVFMGTRIFAAGVEGNLDEGREESRGAKRRSARLARRQTQRRQRRLYRIFRLLQGFGLLPTGPRVDVLQKLQRECEKTFPETTVLPWFLRARALDHRLEPYELGRAFYHLAQRRGFLSNRAEESRDETERSTIKAAISGLDQTIRAAGKRTLGEYMASLNPREIPLRNKPEFSEHYTHRSMFEREFDLIWSAQQPHHPDILTDFRQTKLRQIFFHQRPLKSQEHLVGACELEPGEKRGPLRLLIAQQFRILSFANNLRLRLEDGSERKLTPNERAILLDLTEKSEKLSLVAARRALGIKHLKFTIEEGGEKNVPVNITAVRLRCALGAIWDQLTPEQRDDLVEDAGDGKRCKTDEDMERCGLEKWRLPPEIAKRLPDVHLPAGYARYSAKALKEVVPGLELGLSVEEVIRGHPLYREARQQREPLDLLPKVTDVIPEIRNPAVLRALTELRKAVNAIIRRYGKPESIRIELARDLKKSRNERQRETGRNREREKLRELAKKELAAQDPIRWQDPRRTDIEKYLLAMEAKWRCPYTGAEYGFTDVFGDHPTVDIEHIVPRSRSLDDSFLNKTLTFRSTNIEKGNDTPREWLFESNPERYDHMVRIVKDFDPRFEVGKKLKRFAMDVSDPESLLREFVERQLQETRYASKLASRYLGVLYGGICDAQGERRVFACAGQATAKLREAWDLNAILNPERKPKKSRDDHRHHAIDALTVALSSESLIKQLADAAGDADHRFRRKIVMPVPWNGFAQQAREKVESINVSHRPARRLSGPLHEETFYSRPRIVAPANGKGKPKRYVHYRVPVTSLDSAKKFGDIVDSRVSAAVEAKAEELGGGGNKFLNNWPVLITHKGDRVLIKRVRIRKVETVVCLGKNGRERYVISGSNHHAEVVARLDSHGRIVGFECKTVTLIEALERKRQGVDVVQRNHGPGFQFICTLSEGDLVQVKRSADSPDPSIWRVRSVRQTGQLDLTPATDARLKADADLWSPTVASLFKKGGRKVLVTHLGEVTPAND